MLTAVAHVQAKRLTNLSAVSQTSRQRQRVVLSAETISNSRHHRNPHKRLVSI
jgi:hypothetical protein